MSEANATTRKPDVDIDPMFYDRWSPRAFLPEPIPQHQIDALFEAARWAPSCFNAQPWVFVYATSAEDRARFAATLVDKNREWARGAPVLMYILARRNFSHNGKPNRTASFDAGAAWMSLALQARKLGLHTHAMAGFQMDKAYELLGVSKDSMEIIAAVAVGRRAEPSDLPEDLASREAPNSRNPRSEIAFEARVPGGS